MSERREFLWGASTSAHQVEGNNTNSDWWQWEKVTPGVTSSGLACDHYNRYREDFVLAKNLSHNAHRLSIEWSRVEPTLGTWNRGAINHYREVLTELRRLGLVSFVTLHHFTNPKWLAEGGGWTNRRTPEYFERYVDFVVQHLGDLVDFWITINEPNVYASQSYWHGKWPPQHQSFGDYLRVIGNLSRAHQLAYKRIHQRLLGAKVGSAQHVICFLPERAKNWGDKLIANIHSRWFNHRWFKLTGDTHDFIGLNYYFSFNKRFNLWPPQIATTSWSGPVSDLKWAIRPEGLTQSLLEVNRYQKPIYVTENGLADGDDRQRADFIRSHLRAVEQAQAQGVDVRGYLHWSLLDNFEWAEGFEPRFGLVEVDYKTMERRVRPSAYVYKAIIEQAKKI